ncbi:MAG: ABC transporter permease [Melioribacteraceae bacterium]|nr:ABC transporter permease [Melioribacteraceae bacterium]MCF8264292.1 ABC transporter permease [Melioribacteraceae bacterium]MCF8431057.1 ABC transporter permease [Melioribacteraceae bacterium]
MSLLVSLELQKIFSKWRTYIGFIAIGVLIPIVQIALVYEGDKLINFATQGLKNSFVFVGDLFNGYLVAHLVQQSLIIHIPFLIVLVGGDILAGEATAGTYRMMMTRPITRFQFITSKFLAGTIYTNLLLLWMMFMGLVVSIIIFGTGELLVLKDKIYIFAADDVLWRFILAFGYSALSMTTVMALSFFFSSLVENAIGPIVASMAVIIIFIIISALPIEALDVIKPYLFTNHMNAWREFMSNPVDLPQIVNSGLILTAHIIGLYLLTLFIFKRKDILS